MTKPILFSLLLFIVVTTQLKAQEGKLEIRKSIITKDGVELEAEQVLSLMVKSNWYAYWEFRKARSYRDAGYIIGSVGSTLLFFPVGTVIDGGDPEWRISIGGAAVLLILIPIEWGFRAHARKAVDMYNGSAAIVSRSRHKPSFSVSPCFAGVRLTMKF